MMGSSPLSSLSLLPLSWLAWKYIGGELKEWFACMVDLSFLTTALYHLWLGVRDGKEWGGEKEIYKFENVLPFLLFLCHW